MIVKANKEQIKQLSVLAKKTRDHMLNLGLQQWLEDYPNHAHFLTDYEKNGLYIYQSEEQIIASISILPEDDEAYKEIQWLRNNSMVIHRVVVDPHYQKMGIGVLLFQYAIILAKEQYYDSIKVDTHPDNHRMQGLIKKIGFVEVGYLSGINRLAYELVL